MTTPSITTQLDRIEERQALLFDRLAELAKQQADIVQRLERIETRYVLADIKSRPRPNQKELFPITNHENPF